MGPSPEEVNPKEHRNPENGERLGSAHIAQNVYPRMDGNRYAEGMASFCRNSDDEAQKNYARIENHKANDHPFQFAMNRRVRKVPEAPKNSNEQESRSESDGTHSILKKSSPAKFFAEGKRER